MGLDERPLRADAARNRRRILDAARQVLAAEGADAGVDDIARVAEVGVGTIYRRFPTKDDLVTEVIRDRLTTVAARVEAASALGDPWAAFAGAVEALAELVGQDRALYELMLTQESVRAAMPAERERIRLALRPVLDRAQAAGVVRDDVVVEDLVALATVAARLPAWRVERQPGLWRRYLGIVLDGLRPEAASALGHPPPSG